MSNLLKPNIKLIGVGGCGGNTIARIKSNDRMKSIAVNTDVNALSVLKDTHTFAIGPKLTNGQGAGGDPTIAKKAIKESKKQIEELLLDTDLLFITAGLGGGTGSGATPLITEICRKNKIPTIGVFTMPFSFEGVNRTNLANSAIENIKSNIETFIIIDNNSLLNKENRNISIDQAFILADSVIDQSISGIYEIINTTGTINVDFSDLLSLLKNGGESYMSKGIGSGNNFIEDAIVDLTINPMIQNPFNQYSKLLVNIHGGNDINFDNIEYIVETLRKKTHENSNIIFGFIQNKKWKKQISITALATSKNYLAEITENDDDSSYVSFETQLDQKVFSFN